MYKGKTIAVVVPAYNEGEFIGDVLETIPSFVDRIYPVDDGSTDETWTEIRTFTDHVNDTERMVTNGGGRQPSPKNLGHDPLEESEPVDEPRTDPRIVPLRHDENRGVGAAIKTGYLRALEDELDVIAVMGGDGQMDPDYLDRILEPVVEEEVDYAKGNRLLNREFRREMPTFRLAGNAILTFLTKIASGYWKMMDPQNGYTAISHDALDNIAIQNLYEYYGYCNDILVKLNAKGMRIADVNVPAVYGEEESDIFYPMYIVNLSGMLLRNFFWRLKVRYFVLDFHPLGLFYLFGIATGAWGLASGVWSIYTQLVLGEQFFVRISISLLFFLIGSLFLLFAMLFDMQANEDREVHR